MDEIIVLAVKLITAILGIILTTVVIPWLKEKRVYSIVKTAVRAAEKLAETAQIDKEDKKEFVLEYLESRGIKITTEIEILIESCVEELDCLKEVIFQEIK